MFNDTPDGTTMYCTHENKNEVGICPACMGTNPILQIIEEQKKEFDVIAGEDILEHYDKPLPEGHLTRGWDYPESARELDEEKVWDWHTSSIIALLQAQVEMLEKYQDETLKYPMIGVSNDWNKGFNYSLKTQINLLQETIKSMK